MAESFWKKAELTKVNKKIPRLAFGEARNLIFVFLLKKKYGSAIFRKKPNWPKKPRLYESLFKAFFDLFFAFLGLKKSHFLVIFEGNFCYFLTFGPPWEPLGADNFFLL